MVNSASNWAVIGNEFSSISIGFFLVRYFLISLSYDSNEVDLLYCFSYDTLTIYDGGSITSPMIGKYCDSIPPTIITTSNEVFIHFQTNAVFTESGFKMEYNATSN